MKMIPWKWLFAVLVLISLTIIALFLSTPSKTSELFNLTASDQVNHQPLDKYSIPNLQNHTFTPSPITITETLNLNVTPTVYQFFFSDNLAPNKRISGTMMLPPNPGTYPTIILLRGWADEEIYYSGYGTKNAAAYFAQKGFITVSPDFLGYGDSDPYSDDFIEARFQTYTAATTLYHSLTELNEQLSTKIPGYQVDTDSVAIWGHSNGGQIALAVLAITRKPIPTTLWAPVTIPFPNNILHYSADQDDRGELIKSLVRNFSAMYDTRVFSPTSYIQDITAPILVHQGSADESVPQTWNDDFVASMKKLDKDITYFTYPGTDHNMRPAWGTVIGRDVEFFKTQLQETEN
jgi:dipeptidyl aminopeptidase/acylaminoacyl peptidase